VTKDFPMTESEILDEIRKQLEGVGGSSKGIGLPLEEKMYETMVSLFKAHKRPIKRAEILREIGFSGCQSASDAMRLLEEQGRAFRVSGSRVAGWVPKVV